MSIQIMYLTPRDDLHPDWIEVQLSPPPGYPLFPDVIFAPGTQFMVGTLLLEVIEETYGDESPFLCKVIRDAAYEEKQNAYHYLVNTRDALALLRKYGTAPEPQPQDWWLWRFWRRLKS